MSSHSHNNDNFLSDLTDGRDKGNWESRYSIPALKEIKKERDFLLLLLFISFCILVTSYLFFNKCVFNVNCDFSDAEPYVFGFLGGLIGGTIFSMKWLVHSVAKYKWNMDRRLWRILTPFLSATIGFLVIVLLNTDILVSDTGDSYSLYKSFGIGFLAGYFSDNAIGKLTEIAQVLFGSVSKGK